MSTGLETLRYPPTEQENYDEMPIGSLVKVKDNLLPSLLSWFVECNGQQINDADSDLDGEYIPNLNGSVITKSVTYTSGSNSITMTTTKDIHTGQQISSTAIPSSETAYIISIDSDTTASISIDATSTGAVSTTIGGNTGLVNKHYTVPWTNASDWTNAEFTVNHNMGENSANLKIRFLLSPDGTDDSAMEVLDTTTTGVVNTSDLIFEGVSILAINSNSFKIQTGIYGIDIVKDDGTLDKINSESWYYKIVVESKNIVGVNKESDETYICKHKNSGKVKLITGFNVTGEEFGNFSESGANVKPTDRLAVFYPDGSVYKNVYARRLRYSQPKTISTTPYTILEDDPIELLINFSTGIINLPENPQNGQEIQIIKTHATQGAITITPDGAHTIDGASSIDIDSQYDYAKVKWIGSIWTLLEYKDHGSNTNGNWMRYSDGTLTMAGQKAIPSGAEVTITFPKEAQSVPYVTTAIDRDGGYGGLTVMIKGITTTNFAVDVVLNGAPDGGTAEWICSGRWRA